MLSKPSLEKVLSRCQFTIVGILILLLAFSVLIGYMRLENERIGRFIKLEIDKAARECGKGYYLSHITVDGRGYRFSNIYTLFNDSYVVGVIDGNAIYNKKNERMDVKTYDLLNNTPDMGAIYYEDLEDLREYTTIYKLLKGTKSKLHNGGFSVVKKYYGTIYVFTLTNSQKDNKACEEAEFKKVLNTLATNVKGEVSWAN